MHGALHGVDGGSTDSPLLAVALSEECQQCVCGLEEGQALPYGRTRVDYGG